MLMLGDKTVVPLTELLRNSGFKKWSITRIMIYNGQLIQAT